MTEYVYQTHVGDLMKELEARIHDAGLGNIASISVSDVAKQIGVTFDTFKTWHDASIGGETFLTDYRGSTLRKFERYFSNVLGRDVQVIERVPFKSSAGKDAASARKRDASIRDDELNKNGAPALADARILAD